MDNSIQALNFRLLVELSVDKSLFFLAFVDISKGLGKG